MHHPGCEHCVHTARAVEGEPQFAAQPFTHAALRRTIDALNGSVCALIGAKHSVPPANPNTVSNTPKADAVFNKEKGSAKLLTGRRNACRAVRRTNSKVACV